MKKILKLTLVVALMFSATSLFGQRFGRVDLAAIITNMPEYQEAQTNLEAYATDLQDQLEQIQVEFNTKYMEYETNLSTYSDAVRQLKETELQQLQQRFQEFQQIAQQDMQRKEMEVMEPIYAAADEAVKTVSQAGGYLVIFSTTGNQGASANLAYFDAEALTDITAEVMNLMGITPAPATAE